MNDRQRGIIDAATERVMAIVGDVSDQDAAVIADAIYQLALDVLKPPSATGDAQPARRTPAAGELLPPSQRASWARSRTEHDG